MERSGKKRRRSLESPLYTFNFPSDVQFIAARNSIPTDDKAILRVYIPRIAFATAINALAIIMQVTHAHAAARTVPRTRRIETSLYSVTSASLSLGRREIPSSISRLVVTGYNFQRKLRPSTLSAPLRTWP